VKPARASESEAVSMWLPDFDKAREKWKSILSTLWESKARAQEDTTPGCPPERSEGSPADFWGITS
jgi:hypothetical protein